MDFPRTCGIVLAGGESRRMGRDKALVCHNGTTMIERAVEALQHVTIRTIVVASTSDKYCVPGAEVIPDLYPGAGPVGGIVTGLTAAGPGCHLVLACDMPAVKEAILNRLLEAAQDYRKCDAAVPEIGGELEPLCAAYRDTAAPKLAAFMESGRRSAREAMKRLSIIKIPEEELQLLDPDLSTFININTPDDLAALNDQRNQHQTPNT